MIDPRILNKRGCTKERIRTVFTATLRPEEEYESKEDYEKAKELVEHREKFENRIYEDIQDGILHNLRSYYLFASADLAWDGNIITKEIVPFMLYAQGKLSFDNLQDRLKKCGCDDEDLERICGKKDEDGNFKEEGLGRLIEMPVNLVRSLLQRRAAAQIARFIDQYPFFKYDTYSKSYEAQLRADALTQRVEMMSNQYEDRKSVV